MKLKVLDIKGKVKEDIEFNLIKEDYDECKSNHSLYLLDNYQKNHDKVPCASTKTRSMVRGGGAKPYKQKGTGNARRGTNRTPLRRGGGVIFGPRPHNHKSDLNKKMIRKALRWLLVSKSEQLVIIDSNNESKLKTKDFDALLISLKRGDNDKVVLLSSNNEENIELAFRNIANSSIESVFFTHVSKLVYAKYIFLTKSSLEVLIERLNNVK
jgi:large subunit ribosomal protein L4